MIMSMNTDPRIAAKSTTVIFQGYKSVALKNSAWNIYRSKYVVGTDFGQSIIQRLVLCLLTRQLLKSIVLKHV